MTSTFWHGHLKDVLACDAEMGETQKRYVYVGKVLPLTHWLRSGNPEYVNHRSLAKN
jgi:hypothetical protein